MIRILLVTPGLLVSSVIARVLKNAPDIRTVASARTVEEALGRAGACDVALVSTSLQDGRALDLVQRLSDGHPRLPVLVLGLNESEEEIMRYVEAGAAGYVLRDDSIDGLISKIRAIQRKETLVSPEIAWALIARVGELAQSIDEKAALSPFSELTPRESDVLVLLARDLSDAQIANCLMLSRGTVKSHVHRILRKLNVSSRKEAAALWASAQHVTTGNHQST